MNLKGISGFRGYGSIYLLIAISFLVFYFLFDPLQSRFMPQCVFYRLTGYQCVGCGTQRMLHALLHGDFAAAFKANALVFCGIPLLIFMVWLELTRKRHPGLYAGVHSRFFIILIGVILLVWMFVRNILSL